MKVSIGVDLHKSQFTVYFKPEASQVGRFGRLQTNEVGYRAFERQVVEAINRGDRVSLAVESTANARYFRNRVEALGVRVVVVNSLKFKVVNQSVKETDQHDASTLAEFLEKDMLPESWLCSQESEELSRLLNVRKHLVESIIRVYIDDVSRFRRPEQLAAYAGLVPWVQNSNKTERYGKITKRGTTELRTALVQVVLGMVRVKRRTEGYRIMIRYARMKKEKGSGRSIIATARLLSEIIWHILRNNESFDPSKMEDPKLLGKAIKMHAAASDAA